jgi:hypothetical protein
MDTGCPKTGRLLSSANTLQTKPDNMGRYQTDQITLDGLDNTNDVELENR